MEAHIHECSKGGIEMGINKRKKLLEEYKMRKPEIGIIGIKCRVTGDIFLGITNDTSVGFNRHKFQLEASMHPNKELDRLWKKYGKDEFEFLVVDTLEYDDTPDEHMEELEMLLEESLEKIEGAKRLSAKK